MLQIVASQRYKFILYGGGVGGGKSYLMAILFVGLAIDFPKTRYAIIRKNLTTLRRTTFQTFIKFLEENEIPYKLDRVNLIISLGRGSTIEFIEADDTKDPDFNKLKGLEVTAAGIDEANEIVELAYNTLLTRVGRWNNDIIQPFIFMTCNPSQSWIKSKFYNKWEDGTLETPYYFLPALPTDNPYLGEEYIKQLEYLPEAEYQRYVKGNWDYSDDPNQLIKYEWLKDNVCDPFSENITDLGIDVAREGDDRSVIAYVRDFELGKLETVHTQDTMILGETVFNRYHENKQPNLKVDGVGVGGGVVDFLKGRGLPVQEYKAGFAVDNHQPGFLRYVNQRAKDYWELREGLRQGTIKLIKDDDLWKELLAQRYTITDKYIQIEEKAKIKKRLGVSPDLADAVVIAFSRLKKSYQAIALPSIIL